MRTLVLGVLLMVFLVATSCAPKFITWTKADLRLEDLDRDTYECIRDASYSSVGGAYTATWTHRLVDRELYKLCMRARGYVEAK